MESAIWYLVCGLFFAFLLCVAWSLARNEDRLEILLNNPGSPGQFMLRPGAHQWWYRDWLLATADDFDGVAVWGSGWIGVLADREAAVELVDAMCELAASEYAE